MNKVRCKVSIIVPVYNAEKYIKRCLDSLLMQTLDDLEYILVDDCSEDRSLGLIQEIQKQNPDKNIQIIKSEKNSGVSHSRNVGLNCAIGEFVYFFVIMMIGLSLRCWKKCTTMLNLVS